MLEVIKNCTLPENDKFLTLFAWGRLETPQGWMEGHVARSIVVTSPDDKRSAMRSVFNILKKSPYSTRNKFFTDKVYFHEVEHGVNDWKDGSEGLEQLPGFFVGVVDYSGFCAFVYLMVGKRTVTERLRSFEGPGNDMTNLDKKNANELRKKLGI